MESMMISPVMGRIRQEPPRAGEICGHDVPIGGVPCGGKHSHSDNFPQEQVTKPAALIISISWDLPRKMRANLSTVFC
jgi:hypothetical protein